MTTEYKLCSCGCGKKVFRKPNSTIWNKVHPNCQLKEAFKKNSIKLESAKPFDKNIHKGLVSKSPKLRAMENADKWFSRFIRLKYSFERSGVFFCYCYTCGRPHGIKNIDNGHYHNRENKATRFHENNCRPQCVHCNQHKSGRHTIFGDKILKEIGNEEFEELRKLALSNGEDNELFYREQAKRYRLKFNELVKEKGGNPWK